MSADSIIPDPYDGQSYNRYTYVNNRPLSFTDPTGHDGDCSSSVCPEPPKLETVTVNGQKLHGTMDEIQNIKGLTNEQRFWVAKLTVGLGAKNVDISTNFNGNLALKFTCSDAECTKGGREINDTYGGTETFAGGESTGAAQNASGDSAGAPTAAQTNQSGYHYTGPIEDADKQAAEAWSNDSLSDGTQLKLHKYSDETGFTVSSDDTEPVPTKKVCVACTDGKHEGTQFDYSSVPAGAYPSHAHTLRQGNIPGPGDNNSVKDFGRGYVLTPQGAFAIEPAGAEYGVRQIIGDPLKN